MARADGSTKSYKVTLSTGLDPFLQRLADLGIYGATPSEVLRKFAESKIEEMITSGFFEKAQAAVTLVTTKKPSSSDNK